MHAGDDAAMLKVIAIKLVHILGAWGINPVIRDVYSNKIHMHITKL